MIVDCHREYLHVRYAKKVTIWHTGIRLSLSLLWYLGSAVRKMLFKHGLSKLGNFRLCSSSAQAHCVSWFKFNLLKHKLILSSISWYFDILKWTADFHQGVHDSPVSKEVLPPWRAFFLFHWCLQHLGATGVRLRRTTEQVTAVRKQKLVPKSPRSKKRKRKT